jgi:hypothetical protein
MGMLTIGRIPGKNDINGQFKPAANLRATHAHFKNIYKHGTYTFGDLTALCLNLGNDPDWTEALKAYDDGTPGKPSAADTIKDCVIKAMTHQTNGHDDPLPVVINWHDATDNKVDVSQNSTGFTIDIYGYPQPPSSALAERRQNKK